MYDIVPIKTNILNLLHPLHIILASTHTPSSIVYT